MQPQLYLWKGLKESYIKDIKQIHELFCDKIYPVFLDAEKEAEDYSNNKWDEIMSMPGDENSDPSDYADCVQEAGIERYFLIDLMHYRSLSMWISCICQIWEQQIFSFIVNELEKEGIRPEKKEINKGFLFSKEVFKEFQIIFEDLKCWPTIQELRWLVNVIKHAEGDSEEKLRKIRPDYFDKSGFGSQDSLSLYHTSLLEKTLNITLDDFNRYYEGLIAFWDELPERMFCKKI